MQRAYSITIYINNDEIAESVEGNLEHFKTRLQLAVAKEYPYASVNAIDVVRIEPDRG
jgi:hypothetical protein